MNLHLRSLRLLLLLAAGCLLFAGCADDIAPAAPPAVQPSAAATTAPARPAVQPDAAALAAPAPAPVVAAPASVAEVIAANNAFGLRLYKTIAAAEGSKNLFLSPASIAMALAMTYNGAQAETKLAMAATLGLSGYDVDDVNRANRTLLAAWDGADPAVKLALANSLWAKHDLTFKETFLQRNRTFYQARVEPIEFMAPSACKTINAWVSEKTMGKIDNLIKQEDLTADTILILINAIYFKGIWKEQFDPKLTKERAFNLAPDATKNWPMMARDSSFEYLQTLEFQAVRLPYGGGRMHMLVLLPAATSSLKALQAALTPERWRAWAAQFHSAEGVVVLPKFKLEYETMLNTPLCALGMAIAFDRQHADFKAMADLRERICIDKVRHKAFVEVNEEGTEAAAATSVGMMRTTAAMPMGKFHMVVDRPFLFAICDRETEAILFLGSVVEPR